MEVFPSSFEFQFEHRHFEESDPVVDPSSCCECNLEEHGPSSPSPLPNPLPFNGFLYTASWNLACGQEFFLVYYYPYPQLSTAGGYRGPWCRLQGRTSPPSLASLHRGCPRHCLHGEEATSMALTALILQSISGSRRPSTGVKRSPSLRHPFPLDSPVFNSW